MARRQHLTLTVVLAFFVFITFTWFMSASSSAASDSFSAASDPYDSTQSLNKEGSGSSLTTGSADFGLGDSILSGGAIAPRLGNETAKRELGRATWKFLHTMMARFPEQPTPDEQLTLKTFITLFSRLYPCGECAGHFQKLIAKYPPQVSSRNAAAGWACFVHNQVNERLKKPIFDCNNIGDFYDCGCADDPGKAPEGANKGEGELKEREPEPVGLKLEREADGSGSAADTQAVADIVQYQLGMYHMMNGKLPTTQTAAAMFQELCYANKDKLSAGLIIAGWDERNGGQVYSIPLGGSLHKQPYSIGGSGSTYIYGYCDTHWKEGMEEQEAVNFVKEALKEAIRWDGSSGGVIRMVVLTAKGADRHLYLPDSGYQVRHQ
ncbi:Proteasome subunit beta type-1 [Cytospora paraplurivora]|uniref:Sulfhydryl oxidase n=1 Tax=Cytospora paraplurivora TaxID=2898453 RepID=A0AAN9U6K1_9PEZI